MNTPTNATPTNATASTPVAPAPIVNHGLGSAGQPLPAQHLGPGAQVRPTPSSQIPLTGDGIWISELITLLQALPPQGKIYAHTGLAIEGVAQVRDTNHAPIVNRFKLLVAG